MRMAFVGASSVAISTARDLSKRGHDVIMVERNEARIEELSEQLDCGFIHGDGTRPDILKEVSPEGTEVIFCLTGNDQANIIASLVARSLGFKKVVTKLEDPEFEHVAIELNLESIIVPSRTIARYLADMVEGQDALEISSIIKGNARMFSFVVHNELAGPLELLQLPEECQVVCIYRQDDMLLPRNDIKLKLDDEVVLITRQKQMAKLRDYFIDKAKNAS